MEKLPIKYYPKWLKWRFRGTTIYPIGIFIKSQSLTKNNVFMNHELIHWQQQKEMIGIFFYLWYFIEWVVNSIKFGKKAYIKLSHEQEAYDNDQDLNYLSKRKPYAWIRYLKYKPIK